MQIYHQKYPNRLREVRKKCGLTQEEVIKHLGLKSTNRLCRWEHGKSTPSVFNAIKLAELYQASVEDFYK